MRERPENIRIRSVRSRESSLRSRLGVNLHGGLNHGKKTGRRPEKFKPAPLRREEVTSPYRAEQAARFTGGPDYYARRWVNDVLTRGHCSWRNRLWVHVFDHAPWDRHFFHGGRRSRSGNTASGAFFMAVRPCAAAGGAEKACRNERIREGFPGRATPLHRVPLRCGAFCRSLPSTACAMIRCLVVLLSCSGPEAVPAAVSEASAAVPGIMR